MAVNVKNLRPALPEGYDPYDMTLKRQFNPKADAMNFIHTPRKLPLLACGAKAKGKGGPCTQPAGTGTDHVGYGRCKYHGGCTTGPRTPEGKAIVAQNPIKHGFYSSALRPREREIYEELNAKNEVTLTDEIYVLKAKILAYLENKRRDWERYYEQKVQEKTSRVKCNRCGGVYHVESLRPKAYCPLCSAKADFDVLEVNDVDNDELAATRYADESTKIYFNEGESGARNYFHAGTAEDRTLDRALNTLRRLVEAQARLNPSGTEGIMDKINQELRAASHGQVSVAWNNRPAQARKEGPE